MGLCVCWDRGVRLTRNLVVQKQGTADMTCSHLVHDQYSVYSNLINT